MEFDYRAAKQYALRVTRGNHPLADDVVQDSFIRWTKDNTITIERLVRCSWKDILRRETTQHNEDGHNVVVDCGEDTGEIFPQVKLPPRARQIGELLARGLGRTEIAKMLNIGAKRVDKAIGILRRELAEELELATP